MLKDKDKGMSGVNELDDDVLEQAAGGRIEKVRDDGFLRYDVYSNKTGERIVSTYSKSQAESWDKQINDR